MINKTFFFLFLPTGGKVELILYINIVYQKCILGIVSCKLEIKYLLCISTLLQSDNII